MANLNIGDVVKLKSGGPKMTVAYVYADEITCKWFDEQNRKHEDTFHIDQLEKDKPARARIINRVI